MINLFKKPFYKCKTKEEKVRWFKTAKYWKELDEDVINLIVDKFIGDQLAFEVFVFISEACNLIKKNYIPLMKTVGNNENMISLSYALTLYNIASVYRDKLINGFAECNVPEKEMSLFLNYCMSGYESAVVMDPSNFSSYYQMAIVRGKLIGKYDEGIKYCQQGLEKIEEIDEIDEIERTQMQQSRFYKDKVIPTTEELKRALNELLDDLNQKKKTRE